MINYPGNLLMILTPVCLDNFKRLHKGVDKINMPCYI